MILHETFVVLRLSYTNTAFHTPIPRKKSLWKSSSLVIRIFRCIFYVNPKTPRVLDHNFVLDHAALATHCEHALQSLITKFSSACSDFGLTISLKKTQDATSPPNIKIGDHPIKIVDEFMYLV